MSKGSELSPEEQANLEKLGHLLEEIWHPDDGELLAYVLEEVADEEREGLTQHLATCKACARELEDIRELAMEFGVVPATTANRRSMLGLTRLPANWLREGLCGLVRELRGAFGVLHEETPHAVVMGGAARTFEMDMSQVLTELNLTEQFRSLKLLLRTGAGRPTISAKLEPVSGLESPMGEGVGLFITILDQKDRKLASHPMQLDLSNTDPQVRSRTIKMPGEADGLEVTVRCVVRPLEEPESE